MYRVRRTEHAPKLDGKLDSTAWQSAERTPLFVDMATGAPALYDTQAALLWDDVNLYVGFWVEDPYPRAELTERDSLVFQENDIELFIDGGDCYYEFEINALGTIYEVFFIWNDAYERGSRFDIPEFDIYKPGAFTFAGDFDRIPTSFWRGTHPRGVRWAFLDWDFPGLRSAVHVQGELNSARRSKNWTVELAFPWAGMKHLTVGRSLPPEPGDIWKLFLGRFQNIAIGQSHVQAAWCVSPHGTYDTHMPEKFTPVQFKG